MCVVINLSLGENNNAIVHLEFRRMSRYDRVIKIVECDMVNTKTFPFCITTLGSHLIIVWQSGYPLHTPIGQLLLSTKEFQFGHGIPMQPSSNGKLLLIFEHHGHRLRIKSNNHSSSSYNPFWTTSRYLSIYTTNNASQVVFGEPTWRSGFNLEASHN